MAKAKTFTVGTFRRPDRAGAFLWSCDCGESGLINRKGEAYTNRQGAASGGAVHLAAQHGQTLPPRGVAATDDQAPDRLDTLLRQHSADEKRRANKA
jgi:hypothetical protein